MTPMELNRRELKARARERMGEAHPPFWLITLVYLLLTTGVSAAVDLAGLSDLSHGGMLPLFLTLLIALYSAVMNFGYQLWALRVYRGQEAGYGTLIDGFSIAGRVLLMELNILACTLCWALLFGMLAAVLIFAFALLLPPFLAVLLLYAAILVISIWISYRYAMAPYLLIDRPEAGPFAAVRESVALMRGWKWEFFKLDFSFFGWILLNFLLSSAVELTFSFPTILTLLQATEIDPSMLLAGLSLPWYATLLSTLIQIPISLWVDPYLSIAHAGFYQARVQLPEPPPWNYSGPYDGPYNDPEL